MNVSKNFELKEFIDPVTYKQYGGSAIWFLDRRIPIIAQKLRDRLDVPLYVNTWWIPGVEKHFYFQYSGYRPPACPEGASKSQHKFGRAADLKTLFHASISVAEGAEMIRDELRTNYHIYKELGLTTIEHEEYAPTWCHLDCRCTGSDTLFIVKP